MTKETTLYLITKCPGNRDTALNERIGNSSWYTFSDKFNNYEEAKMRLEHQKKLWPNYHDAKIISEEEFLAYQTQFD